ncbi:uncharacterized protein P174DRAFT_232263 [Aspergillus novofumigatus IBT 16806]|uniref:Uncharacterized protein n=1 Tax=Aspergillus novofumigatus (strain IBT 16806) TaxID=1392255 RepID=A0A2I1C6Z4_ASPN1|nr:uncharacterized protein P174DRAFT_232263 [Aspergillus novofumigatus IBT 16806]PKX93412.1 hypothetical protein P174DRAFT_232263 [Aspergillus novofumigatus IBT 16806]
MDGVITNVVPLLKVDVNMITCIWTYLSNLGSEVECGWYLFQYFGVDFWMTAAGCVWMSLIPCSSQGVVVVENELTRFFDTFQQGSVPAKSGGTKLKLLSCPFRDRGPSSKPRMFQTTILVGVSNLCMFEVYINGLSQLTSTGPSTWHIGLDRLLP